MLKLKSLTLRGKVGLVLGLLAFSAILILLRLYIEKRGNSGDKSSEQIAFGSQKEKVVERGGIAFRQTNWKELVQLNYETGERGGNLAEIENRMVRIPGYIVPLTDDVDILDEFLFVPNDQACIHVPPPPPNLIVKAKLKKKLSFEDVFNPSWLMGKLQIVKTQSQYGSAAYKIDDAELEKYEEESP